MLTNLQKYMPRKRTREVIRKHWVKIVCFLAAIMVLVATVPLRDAFAAEIPTLKPGMSGDAVKALQATLVNRGYMAKVDGKYGQATVAAVKLFQKQAGLKADGVAGTGTQNALNALTGSARTNTTLHFGDKSADVKLMQSRLMSLGYLNVTSATDFFGSKTKTAVIKFQKKVGISSDGTAGPRTLVRLYSSNAPKIKPATAPSTPDDETLRLGMSGSAVKAMQSILVKRGYLRSADGKFGGGTKAAVRQFQRNAGLPADGSAGPKTLGALTKLVGDGKTNLTMKSGSKGSEVTILRQRLIDLGYLRGVKAGGSYDTATKAAVLKFQAKIGLKADGAAGPKTLVQLYFKSAPPYMTKGEKAASYAKQYLGVRYVWGGTSPRGFDCSGLIYYVYKTYFHITLPRVSRSMASSAGKGVKLSQAKPGDILCFGSRVSSVGHVGMYVGNNQFIQAPQAGDVVKITKLTSHWKVATVRRIFADE